MSDTKDKLSVFDDNDEITTLRADNERLRKALQDIITDSFSVYAIQVASAALEGE